MHMHIHLCIVVVAQTLYLPSSKQPDPEDKTRMDCQRLVLQAFPAGRPEAGLLCVRTTHAIQAAYSRSDLKQLTGISRGLWCSEDAHLHKFAPIIAVKCKGPTQHNRPFFPRPCKDARHVLECSKRRTNKTKSTVIISQLQKKE